MPNSIAMLMGIVLMFWLLSFLGTFGIIFGVIVMAYNLFLFWPRNEEDSFDSKDK